MIDGCFLRCHGRILENIFAADKLVQFDAMSHYNRYTDIFDYDDVPEEERKEMACSVADWVLESLANSACQNAASSCCQTEEKSTSCFH